MWTVIGEPTEVTRDAHKDMEGSHAYMILTQDDSSMVRDNNIYFKEEKLVKNNY